MGRGAITARVGKVWYTQDGVRRATVYAPRGEMVISLPFDRFVEGDRVQIECGDIGHGDYGWRLSSLQPAEGEG